MLGGGAVCVVLGKGRQEKTGVLRGVNIDDDGVLGVLLRVEGGTCLVRKQREDDSPVEHATGYIFRLLDRVDLGVGGEADYKFALP